MPDDVGEESTQAEQHDDDGEEAETGVLAPAPAGDSRFPLCAFEGEPAVEGAGVVLGNVLGWHLAARGLGHGGEV